MRLILSGSSRCGTTITRDILSEHPDIHMTNELRLYYENLLFIKPEQYFNFIKKAFKKSGWDYNKLPIKIDMNNFTNKCMSVLEKDTIENRILAAEKIIFNGKYKIFGDKGAKPSAIYRMNAEGIKFKLILIYRDGRDVAASGVRHKRGLAPPWSNKAIDNAVLWAINFNNWFSVIDSGVVKDYIIIKFEDYIDKPEYNFRKIAEFLNLNPDIFLDIQREKFIFTEAHRGYHTKWCPNWRKTFPYSVKEVLKRLEYI